MDDLTRLFPVINDVVRESGKITRKYFGTQLEINRKPDSSPVTRADLEVERFLRDSIERLFPDHSILGEEFGETRKSSAYRWIIDPIDGTQSFILSTPLFGTIIALERDEYPVLGVIYLPVQDQLMIGSKETGTFLDGKRCAVSRTASLADARLLITTPSSLAEEKMAKLAASSGVVRGFGDCYGYFMVACGVADVMLDPVMSYHDVAPLLPVVEGAGGRLTDLSGRVDLKAGNSLATNGLLHEQVTGILRGQEPGAGGQGLPVR
ncbi:MAG TPA: inositol monophosphatase family protein [Blastocatellia bacterium]|jgi:myo-inositol-1(or 4)-monophosphatase